MYPPCTSLRQSLLPLLAVVLVAHGVKAESAAELEAREAKAALAIAQTQVATLEARLKIAKEQINSLGEGMANLAGGEKQARENYEKLRMQQEALGPAALNGSSSELEQRLLAAVSDLGICNQQKKQLTDALVSLSESALAYAKAAPNAPEDAQQNLNRSLSLADKVARETQADHSAGSDADLQHAQVVSVKEELGIAVLNIGSRQGVHPGMPLTIYRQDKPIARAMVADVRMSICGAIIQELINEKDGVKVGDSGRVETSKR